MAASQQQSAATVIDASGLILGRLSSVVAKRLLMGEFIVIVNAEKAVVSGRRLSRVKEMRAFLEVGHPGKGPFHPRRPDLIVRRAVWGMLPRRLPKGQTAFKRLKVFLGVPSGFKGVTFETVPGADVSKLSCPYVAVGELAREVGYKALRSE